MVAALTVPELAEEFGMSVDYVRRQTQKPESEGGWPHFRLGRNIRFLPQHIERIVSLRERNVAVETVRRPESGPSAEALLALGVSPRAVARRRAS